MTYTPNVCQHRSKLKQNVENYAAEGIEQKVYSTGQLSKPNSIASAKTGTLQTFLLYLTGKTPTGTPLRIDESLRAYALLSLSSLSDTSSKIDVGQEAFSNASFACL